MNQYQHREGLKSIIEQSALLPDERQSFIHALSQADDRFSQALMDLCTKDAGWIEKLYTNLKSKQAAIAADDPAMWEKIIQEEEQILREIAEQSSEENNR